MPTSPYPVMRRLVRALRRQKGLTQEGLAERAGLDYKYFQRIEVGGTLAPSVATLEKLGRALGVKPWVLLCDDISLVEKMTGVKDLGRRLPVRRGRPRKGAADE